jgi:protein tyrosine/serine phosphatase
MPLHIAPRLRRSAFALAVAGMLAYPVGAAPLPPPSSAAAATSTAAIRIDNFGRVDAALLRGAQPEGRDFADLRAAGVKTIVNLTSDDADPHEKAMTEAAGMVYMQIPMTTHTVPTPAQLAAFLRIVTDPARQPVYVHCVGGRHRTGVMVAAYRMTHDGWSAAQAFKEMKVYKFGADFLHPEFKQFVYAFHPPSAASAAATSSISR